MVALIRSALAVLGEEADGSQASEPDDGWISSDRSLGGKPILPAGRIVTPESLAGLLARREPDAGSSKGSSLPTSISSVANWIPQQRVRGDGPRPTLPLGQVRQRQRVTQLDRNNCRCPPHGGL